MRYALNEKAKKMDKGIRLTMAASKATNLNNIKQRGGVMTLTRGNWSGRIIKSGNKK